VNFVRDGHSSHLEASAVILAAPAEAASTLIRPLAPTVADELSAIQYPPVVSVFLGYRQQDVGHPMNGFGFLVPSRERRKILGCLWSSSLFPHRAPAGSVGMTVFVGGGRQPELTLAGDQELLEVVLREVESIMQIRGKPVYWSLTRWKKAIPQYTLGYQRVMETLSSLEESYPGLFFCSNYRGGISVGDCIQSSESTARRTTAYVRSVAR
jgi:oxygen-dependent protoporphyrinogen oxidase